MVFQSYAIWPHLDVFDNVAYPLEVARPRVARAEIEKRVMDVLALVGMQAMTRRPATRLSGGQRQQVALARAIVRRPNPSCSTSHCRTSTRGCATACAGSLPR
jgi:iron(III) transport system ATP-binding protein